MGQRGYFSSRFFHLRKIDIGDDKARLFAAVGQNFPPRIDDQRMEEPYGKFAWVYDPEDNKIELWEPKDPSA